MIEMACVSTIADGGAFGPNGQPGIDQNPVLAACGSNSTTFAIASRR